MPNTRCWTGPLPSPSFPQQVASEVLPPFIDTISGEVAVTKRGMVLGMARAPGIVKGVFLSVGGSGKNDSSFPSGEADVYINGVSCLTTRPRITHVSGEASMQKTTFTDAADTGVRAGVVDESAKTFAAGDVITWDFIYDGHAAPTTKIHSVSILVEVEPDWTD